MFEDVKRELYAEGNLGALSNEELYQQIKKLFLKQEQNRQLPLAKQISFIDQIYSSIRGYGALDQLFYDETISEIMINHFDEIYVERQGSVKRSSLQFENEAELEQTIQRIVSRSGREVNQAKPIVDTRLPDGARVNVVLPPISLNGPVVTVRRFPKDKITMEKLIAWGSITEEAADFLKRLVRCRYNLFISGGTSSGKTTFLNILSDEIPPEERIITIEDSAELQIRGLPNLIRLETRNANASGVGQVSTQDLIRTSLRMRPDRIIVGEVRGAEALDMLNAMNTGHDGSLSTGHANSCYDMLSRLETMVLQGNAGLPLAAIRQKIASSLDVIVHLGKLGSKRRVMEICEMDGVQNGEYLLRTLFCLQNGSLTCVEPTLKHDYKLKLYGEEVDETEKNKREQGDPGQSQSAESHPEQSQGFSESGKSPRSPGLGRSGAREVGSREAVTEQAESRDAKEGKEETPPSGSKFGAGRGTESV